MKTVSQMRSYLAKLEDEVKSEDWLSRKRRILRSLFFDGKHWSHQRCIVKLEMARLAMTDEDLGDE